MRPSNDPRSVCVADFDGIGSMATSPLETIESPVVPAGMFDLATTTEVTLDATVLDALVCLLAPSMLANAIPLPATNRRTPITTRMTVCFFTDLLPPLAR